MGEGEGGGAESGAVCLMGLGGVGEGWRGGGVRRVELFVKTEY